MARGALIALSVWACASPAPPPERWPAAADEDAALRLGGARAYLTALDASIGDPPQPLVGILGDAGGPARRGDLAARALLSAWILDAELRRATREQRTLRHVLAEVTDPVDGSEWRAAATAVGGSALSAWSSQDAAGAGTLDYGAALHWFGMAWIDEDDGDRSLVADPGAAPQAVARRRRWVRNGPG